MNMSDYKRIRGTTRDRLKRYAQVLNPPRKYPVWSVKSAAVLMIMVAGVSGILIGLIPDLNVFAKLELVVGVCALSLFWMLFLGLYQGARVKRKDLPSTQFSADSVVSKGSADVGMDVAVEAGSLVDDAWGCLIWLVLLLFGGVLLWAFVQFGGWAIVIVFFAIAWIMYRAMRQVFWHSRECQGNVLKSIGYALLYTTVYTAWLFALLLIGNWASGR